MKILFVDFLNAVWRASVGFGFPNPDVNDDYVIVYNFYRNLRPLVEMFSPDKMYFVLEGSPQFRYDILPQYKGNRLNKQTDDKRDKFHANTKVILEMARFLPVTLAKAAAYEADDTISTLVEKNKQHEMVVLTNDSDYLQLLQRGYENLKVYSPIKKEFMAKPEFPYVDWKCLNGDKSDNIPGILKPAKVKRVMEKVGGLEEFLGVEEQKVAFEKNKALIEFRSVPDEEILAESFDGDFVALREKFEAMEFKSMLVDKTWSKWVKTFDCLKNENRT
jgi:5'-3' exonuclease